MAEKKLKPGWKVWRFDQIATNVNVRIDNPSESGMEHYVGLEHLDPDSLRIRRWGSPDDVEATKLVFKKGDIIFGRRRAYQRKLGVAEFDGICSAHAMVLRAKPEVVLPEFLPFFMQSDLFMNRAVEISVGSLSPTINWKTMAVQEFALPDRNEQRRLVELFKAFEEMTSAHEAALSAANCFYDSLREDVFGEDADRLHLNELILDIQAGKSFVGIDEPPRTDDCKAVLKVSAVGKRAFLPQESKTLISQHEFLHEHAVRLGDVLISRANTPDLVGLACYVERDYPNLMLSDKTLRLVPKQGVPSPLLVEALRTTASRQYLKANATGTGGAMKNISQAKLRAMPVRFPPKDAWPELESLLESAIAAISRLSERLEETRSLQRRGLSELLGGE